MDNNGIHTYVGETALPVSEIPYADVVKYLCDHGFEHTDTKPSPSPAERPVAGEIYAHPDGRQIQIVKTISPYGFEVISDLEIGTSQTTPNSNVLSIGDLVNYVTIGRETTAPEKGGVEILPDIEVTKAMIEYARKNWISKPMGQYSSWDECKADGKTDKYCGYLYHHASPEGHEESLKSAMLLFYRSFKKQIQPLANAANPVGVAQSPVAGGNVYTDQAYTDDFREEWNMYRETDLTAPDEVEIMVDPYTGEIRLIELVVPIEDVQAVMSQVQAGQQVPFDQSQTLPVPVTQQPAGPVMQETGQTANYIRMEQRPPEHFKEGAYRTQDGENGIKLVYGSLKDGNRALQTIYFPKQGFDTNTAAQWAHANGYKVGTKPAEMKMDMPGYAGGMTPRPAMGTKKLVYDRQNNRWVIKGGLEVLTQGIPGVPGVFCDYCHTAISTYIPYKNMKICRKCIQRWGPAHIAK